MVNETNIIKDVIFKKKVLTILMYAGIFLLWTIGFFLIKYLEGNDTEAIIYFTFELVFLAVSAFTAHFIPNDRKETLKFFLIGSLAYILYNLLFDTIIIASNLGTSQSTTIMVLTNILAYSRVVIPLGLIVWQAKKWTFLVGLRKSKKDAIEHYKKHGNDGMM